MLNPSSGPNYTIKRVREPEISYNFFNVIQHYVRPSPVFCGQITEIQVEAVKFFTKCCQIWDSAVQGRQRVSLESLLRSTGVNFADVKQQYIQNFIQCLREPQSLMPLQYIATCLELLTQSASSQRNFVEELFKEKEFSAAVVDLVKADLGKGNGFQIAA